MDTLWIHQFSRWEVRRSWTLTIVLHYFVCLDVQNELSRIEGSGGIIIQKKTEISPEHGFMAVFLDTEGNRVALHSNV